jgi:hypothetical protein
MFAQRAADQVRSAAQPLLTPGGADPDRVPLHRQVRPGERGYGSTMFLFFSNRLGCFGSIVVSVVITLILLLILGVFDGGR